MHLQPVFKRMNLFKNAKFPVSENLFKRGFYIPSGIGTTKKETPDKNEYRRVEHDIPVEIAQIAKQEKIKYFCYL